MPRFLQRLGRWIRSTEEVIWGPRGGSKLVIGVNTRPADVLRCIERFRPSSAGEHLQAAVGGGAALRELVASYEPRIVVLRHRDNVVDMLDRGGEITTAFDGSTNFVAKNRFHEQYRDNREATEIALDIRGGDDQANRTVYGRIEAGSAPAVPAAIADAVYPRIPLYGNVHLVLKPQVFDQATFTHADSVNGWKNLRLKREWEAEGLNSPNVDPLVDVSDVAGVEQLGLVLARHSPKEWSGPREALDGAFGVLRRSWDPEQSDVGAVYVEAQVRRPRVDDIERIIVDRYVHPDTGYFGVKNSSWVKELRSTEDRYAEHIHQLAARRGIPSFDVDPAASESAWSASGRSGPEM